MPGMSGFELVRNLRAARMTLPVILASGGIDAEALNQNPWLQPAVSLPKPFTTDQMLQTVAAALPAFAGVLAGLPTSGDIHVPAPAATGYPTEPWAHWGINE